MGLLPRGPKALVGVNSPPSHSIFPAISPFPLPLIIVHARCFSRIHSAHAYRLELFVRCIPLCSCIIILLTVSLCLYQLSFSTPRIIHRAPNLCIHNTSLISSHHPFLIHQLTHFAISRHRSLGAVSDRRGQVQAKQTIASIPPCRFICPTPLP